MKLEQLSIWSEEEMDIFAPKKKTKREIRQEQKEAFNRRITERVVLSEEETAKYNILLKKEDLIVIVNKHNDKCLEDYENSSHGLMDTINYHISRFSLGTPQLVLTSLSQYFEKEQKDLSVFDLATMYKSVVNAFSEKEQIDTSKFRKINNLTFFGSRQHILMEEYLKSLD